jgi:hypothetical protein
MESIREWPWYKTLELNQYDTPNKLLKQMVQNTRVKRALSRKQVGVTQVSNTGIKPHTGDPHQFNTNIDPTKLH